MGELIRTPTLDEFDVAVAFIRDNWARSRLAHLTFDEDALRDLLLSVLLAEGMSTFCRVAVSARGIEGLLIGGVNRIYGIAEELEATDMLWLVRPGCPAWTAQRLVREFHAWARERGAVRVRHGLLDTMGPRGEWSGNGHILLERQGFGVSGVIMEKEIER